MYRKGFLTVFYFQKIKQTVQIWQRPAATIFASHWSVKSYGDLVVLKRPQSLAEQLSSSAILISIQTWQLIDYVWFMRYGAMSSHGSWGGRVLKTHQVRTCNIHGP